MGHAGPLLEYHTYVSDSSSCGDAKLIPWAGGIMPGCKVGGGGCSTCSMGVWYVCSSQSLMYAAGCDGFHDCGTAETQYSCQHSVQLSSCLSSSWVA